MKTPQTNQTIKQLTPKTNFFIFVKTRLLQYNTTNKGSRPEIQDDPGERGRGKEESRQSSTPPTRDFAPCRRRTFLEIIFRRETVTSENKTTSVKRKNDNESWIKGQCISTQVVKTPVKGGKAK